MNKQKIKLAAAGVLALVVIFELIYIFHINALRFPSLVKTAETAMETATETAETENDNGRLDEIKDSPKSSEEITKSSARRIVVLDPGHGKSSSAMTPEEKKAMGFTQNNGEWGEWRHFKSGTWGDECGGSDCAQDKACWYPIVNGDRDKEPDINLRNARAAKKYLEEMGYKVYLTRDENSTVSNENPSFNQRAKTAFKDINGNYSLTPQAECIVCIHSNGGGGRGSCYVSLEGGKYSQQFIPSDYIEKSNDLGSKINKRITSETSLSSAYNGALSGENYLILFHKSPVPVAYMEIGFYDNSADLEIINSEYDKIGKAIAEGVDDYLGGAEE